MNKLKKIISLVTIFSMIALIGINIYATETNDNTNGVSSKPIGYSIVKADGSFDYYIEGRKISSSNIGARVITSEYEGYEVNHDSWKSYDWSTDYAYFGNSYTTMEHKDTGEYRRHYTRVLINNGKESADSGRRWTNGFRADAKTTGIKSTFFDRLESHWGVED